MQEAPCLCVTPPKISEAPHKDSLLWSVSGSQARAISAANLQKVCRALCQLPVQVPDDRGSPVWFHRQTTWTPNPATFPLCHVCPWFFSLDCDLGDLRDMSDDGERSKEASPEPIKSPSLRSVSPSPIWQG